MTSADLSTTLLNSKSLKEIHEKHFLVKAAQDKKWQERSESFNVLRVRHERAEAARRSDNHDLKKEAILNSKKIFDQVLRDLAGNKLTGHYLLRQVPSIGEYTNIDCVALLREIHHIPSSLAKRIAKGISKSDWELDHQGSSCPRFVKLDDYCMPLARLKSPWIEHLMQSLTLVFSRIGIEDIDHKAVRKSLEPIGLGE